MSDTKVAAGTTDKIGKAFDFKTFRRILKFARPYRNVTISSLILSILLAVSAPVIPMLINRLNGFEKLEYSVAVRFLTITCILVFVTLLGRSIVQFLNTYYTNLLGQNIIKDMRTQLYNHILELKLQYFDRTPVGTVVTRVTSDMETIADVFSDGLIVILNQLLIVIAIIAVMIWNNWQLALISLSVFPVLLYSTYLFQRATRASFQEVRIQVARLNAFVQEHITGMNIVQVFNREDTEYVKFKEINNNHKLANIRSIWYYSIFFPVVDILASISIALIVWWGTRGMLSSHVSFWTIAAYVQYINMLFGPIRQLSDRFNTLQMGVVSSERIFKIFDNNDRLRDTGQLNVKSLGGGIEFKNVFFAYNEKDWVLKDVSLEIKAGQTLAIVGATGAGKSSIINVLGRFYEFQQGSITLDGIDIRDYTIETIRKNISVVLQDVFLFSDTIANNISLYNKNITIEQIQLAAEAIGASEFMESLPGKYEYNVRERGVMLSAGQRQLVSFIRAYVQNPAVLILNEATSSIDTETERLIQKATEKLTERRTSIIIAHRLATIQRADKIVVLDHGEVKEEGTHRELLQLNGFYKQLYEIQFQKEEKMRA